MAISMKEYMERRARGEQVFTFSPKDPNLEDQFYDELSDLIEKEGFIGRAGCIGMRGSAGLDDD